MSKAPETSMTTSPRVRCDGSDGIRSTGAYAPSALGHPRVWLEIDERGYVDCGYCDRRFVLAGGPADPAGAAGHDHAA
jgi:uncharacterized Zn-finger protein